MIQDSELNALIWRFFFRFLQHVNVTTKPKSAITKLADATAQPKESLEKSVIAVISLITIMGILSKTLAIVSIWTCTCPSPTRFFWDQKSHFLFFHNKTSNFISYLNDDLYEDSFEVYKNFLGQKLMILAFCLRFFSLWPRSLLKPQTMTFSDPAQILAEYFSFHMMYCLLSSDKNWERIETIISQCKKVLQKSLYFQIISISKKT